MITSFIEHAAIRAPVSDNSRCYLLDSSEWDSSSSQKIHFRFLFSGANRMYGVAPVLRYFISNVHLTRYKLLQWDDAAGPDTEQASLFFLCFEVFPPPHGRSHLGLKRLSDWTNEYHVIGLQKMKSKYDFHLSPLAHSKVN